MCKTKFDYTALSVKKSDEIHEKPNESLIFTFKIFTGLITGLIISVSQFLTDYTGGT